MSEAGTKSDRKLIRYIEELSLNAWPSHMVELYDGWLIRFSCNYTYRTNCVEQVAQGVIPVEEKIAYCENVYADFGTPCHFKITPLLDPSFDELLSSRDYEIRHVTEVMTADLTKIDARREMSSGAVYLESGLMVPTQVDYEFENRLHLPSVIHYGDDIAVNIRPVITDEWIRGVFTLNGTCEPALRRIVPSMFKAIPKRTIVANVEIEGRMVASGLAICDREYAGIYAIYVSSGTRRRHYARAICSSLLREASGLGAKKAYLQVVQGNIAAKALYRSLGFSDMYTYWFRSR